LWFRWPPVLVGTHHAAAGVAGVLQVVVQQLGGSVLEGFGQSSQQHGELRGVELEHGDQHHLRRLEAVGHSGWGWSTRGGGGSGGFRGFTSSSTNLKSTVELVTGFWSVVILASAETDPMSKGSHTLPGQRFRTCGNFCTSVGNTEELSQQYLIFIGERMPWKPFHDPFFLSSIVFVFYALTSVHIETSNCTFK